MTKPQANRPQQTLFEIVDSLQNRKLGKSPQLSAKLPLPDGHPNSPTYGPLKFPHLDRGMTVA